MNVCFHFFVFYFLAMLKKIYNIYRVINRMNNFLHAIFVFRSIRLFCCCDIALRTIPHSTRFGHPVGIVIGANVKISENCNIYQNVTIGADRNGGGYPVIGRNVTVGANACVIGNVNIGENCLVGAGSIVVKDVPANSTVVGNPAKVISNETI